MTPARNNNNQQNTNKNQRVDPLQVAGNLFGQILDNTEVRIGPDGVKLEVNDQSGQAADTSEDCDGGGTGQVGVRAGLGGSGGCDCWEVGTDYPGGDLRRVTNPRQVSSVSECQALCRNTSGCQYFSYARKRGRQGTTNCWLKNSISRRRSNTGRISGPVKCGVDIEIAPVDPIPSKGCVTVSGGTTGVACVFPFIFKDKKHNSCTLVDADDGIPWCSTLTDSDGVHLGGQGKWGHCPDSCEADVREQVSELSLESVFGPGHEGVVQTTAFRPSLNQTEITVPAHGDGQFVALDVVIQGLGGQDQVQDPYLLTVKEETCFLNNLPGELNPTKASSGNTGMMAKKHLIQTNIKRIYEVKSKYIYILLATIQNDYISFFKGHSRLQDITGQSHGEV